MTTWDLTAFSSYELGKVAEAFRAKVTEHPQAPAVHVLRSACLAALIVDQRFSEPWDDPTFLPRFQWLRDQLVALFPDRKPIEVEARDVVDAIDTMVAALEARDA